MDEEQQGKIYVGRIFIGEVVDVRIVRELESDEPTDEKIFAHSGNWRDVSVSFVLKLPDARLN